MNNLDHDLLAQDTIHLGRILPVEIWKIVAEKLGNPKRFNNSSPYFRNLLASEKTLSLFQNVLVPLTERFLEMGKPDSLSVRDILQCRQACKSWNAAVDNYVGNTCHYSSESTTLNTVLQAKIYYGFWHEDADISPRETVFHFLKYFEPTHPADLENRNLFILSKLSVTTQGFVDHHVEAGEELTTYLDGISTMLERYGTHVTDFTVKFHGGCFDLEYAVCLRKWLLSMPNLIHLVIKDSTEDFEISLPNLQAFCLTMPFPKLNCLEKIKVRRFTGHLFMHLIQQNDHIYDLDVKMGEEHFCVFNLALSNLKTFKIKFGKNLHHISGKLNSPQDQWPVTTLSISLEDVNDFKVCKEVLKTVQAKFSRTIKTFSLKLPIKYKKPSSISSQSFNDLQICFPNLIEVYIGTSTAISLDFLLPMKGHLQYIFVDARYTLLKKRTLEVPKSIVEFCGFESGDRILDSNIWNQFDQLIEIGIGRRGSMGTKYFYRANWEQREKK